MMRVNKDGAIEIVRAGGSGHQDPRRRGRRATGKATENVQYDDDQVEFMLAMDKYKRVNRRPWPTWEEVLAVFKALGYRKVGPPPFSLGDKLDWSEDAPAEWRFIYARPPMRLVGLRWQYGEPSEYAARFGLTFEPGWICEVEYAADTGYYDPPLSLLLGVSVIRKEIHSKWLRRMTGRRPRHALPQK